MNVVIFNNITISTYRCLRFMLFFNIGESWGMANDGEWRTGQYLVEGVKVIKCFHPRMLTPPWEE